MSSVSQFLTTPWAKPLAGATIAANALTQLGPTGRAYQAFTSDYAVAPQGVAILANTITYNEYPPAPNGDVVVRDANGYIYVLGLGLTLSEFAIFKLDPLGNLISQTATGTGLDVYTCANLAFLSNGNLMVTVSSSSATPNYATYYAIFDTNLNVVVARTLVNNNFASGSGSIFHSSCPLSGGGFAIAYFVSPGSTVQLSLYSNAGALTASVTVAGYGGEVSTFAVGQFSSGDILLAYSRAAGSHEITLARYNTSAVLQGSLVPTGMITTADPAPINIAFVAGFVAVSVVTATGYLMAEVYSSVLVLQGSQFLTTNALTVNLASCKLLLSDGTNFWIAFNNITKLTTAGAATTYIAAPAFGSTMRYYASAFDSMNNIVTLAVRSSDYVVQLAVFNTLLLKQIVSPTTLFTATSPGTSMVPTLLSDGVFYLAASAAQGSGIWKLITTYIAGPSSAAATLGTTVAIDITPGTKNIVGLLGSIFKNFSSIVNGGGAINGTTVIQYGAGSRRPIV